MAYGFDADRLLVWLALRDPHAEPLRAGSLCTRHADAMVVPQGWTLDDRREPTPRLFRPPAGAEGRSARRSRATVATAPAVVEQLVLRDVAGQGRHEPADGASGSTVAEVAGPTDQPDPDATVAIPWLPDFDDSDDLGGMLAADSPLLARAFRGTDRPR